MKKSCIVLCATLLFSPVDAEGRENNRSSSALDSLIETIAAEVSAARGLEFKAPVRHGTKTREELRKYLQEIIRKEIPPEKLAAYQKALAKFGLIPQDMHLETFLLELYSEQVKGFYDWHTRTLYLMDGLPDIMLELVISHELTHALQDQLVGIENLPVSRKKADDDRIMAVQALLEGDANSVMIDYALKPAGKDSMMLPDLDPFMEKFMDTAGGRLIAAAPAYIRQNMLFPYVQGLAFVKELRQSGGWAQVDRTLEHPPGSTEQVLHPEKCTTAPDAPTSVTLPILSKELGEGWTFLDRNTLGEFNTGLLIKEFLGEVPEETVAGWDGDLYQIYEQRPSGRTALVWFTTWDSSTDAREFFESYSAVLAKKYDSKAVSDGVNVLTFPTQDGDTGAYMELRGSDVLVLDGVPKTSVGSLVSSAWKATKIETP